MFRNPLADGLIVLILVLLFVGPKRLPMLSRSIGESIKEFKGGVSEHAEDKQVEAASTSTSTSTSTSATEAAPTVAPETADASIPKRESAV